MLVSLSDLTRIQVWNILEKGNGSIRDDDHFGESHMERLMREAPVRAGSTPDLRVLFLSFASLYIRDRNRVTAQTHPAGSNYQFTLRG